MRIAFSDLAQRAEHWAQQVQTQRTRLVQNSLSPPAIGQPAASFTTPPVTSNATAVSLSDNARSQQTAESAKTDETSNTTPELSLIRSLLERLTGEKFQVFNASELHTEIHSDFSAEAASWQQASTSNTSNASQSGFAYQQQTAYHEDQALSYQASGVVKTQDGREIEFNLSLELEYHYEETSSVQFTDAQAVQKDPLVLNFAGPAAKLSDQHFNFDLDADGQSDSLSRLMRGSGFLVFDRNHDGKVNDGRELFGAATGNGFKELAALDDDKNGWIDESDSQYSSLYIWEGGDARLYSLAQKQVGAISTQAISTPFALKGENNALLGNITDSSIFLLENGNTGTIQKIDFTV